MGEVPRLVTRGRDRWGRGWLWKVLLMADRGAFCSGAIFASAFDYFTGILLTGEGSRNRTRLHGVRAAA
jgi:hypothetical protein